MRLITLNWREARGNQENMGFLRVVAASQAAPESLSVLLSNILGQPLVGRWCSHHPNFTSLLMPRNTAARSAKGWSTRSVLLPTNDPAFQLSLGVSTPKGWIVAFRWCAKRAKAFHPRPNAGVGKSSTASWPKCAMSRLCQVTKNSNPELPGDRRAVRIWAYMTAPSQALNHASLCLLFHKGRR
jgi:hypothetical protein